MIVILLSLRACLCACLPVDGGAGWRRAAAGDQRLNSETTTPRLLKILKMNLLI